VNRAQGRDGSNFVVTVGMAVAALMIAQHIAGKATRDALFLSYFDVAQLPKLMMASAVLSVVAVIAMSRLLVRFGPARLIPVLFLGSGLLLAGQWVLAAFRPGTAAIALYVHVAVVNSLVISGFWSVINERFDPYSAKKVVPKLIAASTFGGLIGGLAATAVASLADTRSILLMLSALHLACAGGVGWLSRGQPAEAAHAGAAERTDDMLAPLKRSRLIRRMALLGLLVATTAAVLDYILKAEASASLATEDLILFFSYFYTAVGLGTFLVQSAVGNKALRWFGLGGSMAAWPIAILFTGGITLLMRSLVTVTLMRASANLLYNSFFRAGFELLYTPISPADKRTGKVLIDVGADRAGDLLGGLLVMGILMLPAASGSLLLTTAMLLAAVCLVLILVLQGGYVGQLADNLRLGQEPGDTSRAFIPSARESLASARTTIDRAGLLEEVEALRRRRPRLDLPPSRGIAPGTTPHPAAGGAPVAGPDPVIESIAALRSGDVHRIRVVLASRALVPELLPHAVPLLADERVLGEALAAVGRVANANAGQLVDALLDPGQIPRVKRRLPLLLARSDSPVAVQGLLTGLDDRDWQVRFRCAQGLQRLRQRRDSLRADEDTLLATAEREARELADWSRGRSPDETLWSRRAEMVFFLLGALYDPANLELCLTALRSDNRVLRGTALEYLENLLPAPLWERLQPVLVPAPSAARAAGSAAELERAAAELGSAASQLRDRKAAAAGEAPSPARVGRAAGATG
jgi:AAA family ATP:ADP antiporter